jgi:hypothetical protein
MAKAKMRVGACKCTKTGVRICKQKNGKVKFKGKCKK